VREACKSGKYDAVVLLGGGEPGFHEAREIARPYGIPVTGCAHSQMHMAAMIGSKFSIIDMAENHSGGATVMDIGNARNCEAFAKSQAAFWSNLAQQVGMRGRL